MARIDNALYINGRNALSPDGRTLAVAVGNPLFVTVDLVDLPDGKVRRTLRTPLARAGTPPLLQFGAGGRYLNGAGDGNGDLMERLLLNMLEALGITRFDGFGDPNLKGAGKTPIPGIRA